MNEAALRKALADAAYRFATKCIDGHGDLEVHGTYVLTLEVDWQGSDGGKDGNESRFGATERTNIPRQLHETF